MKSGACSENIHHPPTFREVANPDETPGAALFAAAPFPLWPAILSGLRFQNAHLIPQDVDTIMNVSGRLADGFDV